MVYFYLFFIFHLSHRDRSFHPDSVHLLKVILGRGALHVDYRSCCLSRVSGSLLQTILRRILHYTSGMQTYSSRLETMPLFMYVLCACACCACSSFPFNILCGDRVRDSCSVPAPAPSVATTNLFFLVMIACLVIIFFLLAAPGFEHQHQRCNCVP